jgi:hypothetical protein
MKIKCNVILKSTATAMFLSLKNKLQYALQATFYEHQSLIERFLDQVHQTIKTDLGW